MLSRRCHEASMSCLGETRRSATQVAKARAANGAATAIGAVRVRLNRVTAVQLQTSTLSERGPETNERIAKVDPEYERVRAVHGLSHSEQ